MLPLAWAARFALGAGASAKKVTGLAGAGMKKIASDASISFTSAFQSGIIKGFSAKALGAKLGSGLDQGLREAVRGIGRRRAAEMWGRSSAAMLWGGTGARATAAGNVLKEYGGSAETYNQMMLGMQQRLTGLHFGQAGWLKEAMRKSGGLLNVFGSGANGFATQDELLENLYKIKDAIPVGQFRDVASSLGVTQDVQKAMLDDNIAFMRKRNYLSAEDEKNMKEYGRSQIRTAAAMEKASQLWGSKTVLWWDWWEKKKAGFFDVISGVLGGGTEKKTPEEIEKDNSLRFNKIIKRVANGGEGFSDSDAENMEGIGAFLAKNKVGDKGLMNLALSLGKGDKKKAAKMYSKMKKTMATNDASYMSVPWMTIDNNQEDFDAVSKEFDKRESIREFKSSIPELNKKGVADNILKQVNSQELLGGISKRDLMLLGGPEVFKQKYFKSVDNAYLNGRISKEARDYAFQNYKSIYDHLYNSHEYFFNKETGYKLLSREGRQGVFRDPYQSWYNPLTRSVDGPLFDMNSKPIKRAVAPTTPHDATPIQLNSAEPQPAMPPKMQSDPYFNQSQDGINGGNGGVPSVNVGGVSIKVQTTNGVDAETRDKIVQAGAEAGSVLANRVQQNLSAHKDMG